MIDINTAKFGKWNRVNLEGELNIDSIEKLKTSLIKTIKKYNNIEIDLEKVTKVSLPGLQLLCSAHQTAISQDKNLKLRGIQSDHIKNSLLDSAYSGQSKCFLNKDLFCVWNEGEPDE